MPTVTESGEVETLRKHAHKTLERIRGELAIVRNQVSFLEDEERRLIGALDSLGERATAKVAEASRAVATRSPQPRKRRRRQAAPGVREAELLEILQGGEYSRAELAEKMELSKVRIQQLLKPLNEANKVVSRQDPNSRRPQMLWSAKGSTAAKSGNGSGRASGKSRAKAKRSGGRAKSKAKA